MAPLQYAERAERAEQVTDFCWCLQSPLKSDGVITHHHSSTIFFAKTSKSSMANLGWDENGLSLLKSNTSEAVNRRRALVLVLVLGETKDYVL